MFLFCSLRLIIFWFFSYFFLLLLYTDNLKSKHSKCKNIIRNKHNKTIRMIKINKKEEVFIHRTAMKALKVHVSTGYTSLKKIFNKNEEHEEH